MAGLANFRPPRSAMAAEVVDPCESASAHEPDQWDSDPQFAFVGSGRGASMLDAASRAFAQVGFASCQPWNSGGGALP